MRQDNSSTAPVANHHQPSPTNSQTGTHTGTQNPIQWFRHCAPYINTHRNKTFVIMFGGETVAHPDFNRLIHDFALLHSLGIRLVLVHGARPQIEQTLAQAGIDSSTHKNLRITPAVAMPHILSAVGSIRLSLEARLSMGLANSPMFGARIDAVSGNFIAARPYGVRGGIDHQMTGEVRSIDSTAIHHNLKQGYIVILSPIGFSATGDIFNLSAEDVAKHTACALQADKLILLAEDAIYHDGHLVRELTTQEATALLTQPLATDEMGRLIDCAIGVSDVVERTHILPFAKDGVLLEELFTTDGLGTMITRTPYDQIRAATLSDVVGLLALLKPLEEAGILIARPQQRLEADIEHYSVIERDGMVVGCAALYPLDEHGAEIASIAIHPDYRGGSRGDDLLRFMEHQAKSLGFLRIFALTTHTSHWFIEHGFYETEVTALPIERQQRYHNGRNSKVFCKVL
ncbi:MULTISPECIES: amino-acid N-acetyltransferase [unclassified Moraxella]|uniref:amino-acid N-acetyltransferase n=1 Tax=unclassified Moraxella TaxID=2685852 RepID=UPI00359CD3E1